MLPWRCARAQHTLSLPRSMRRMDAVLANWDEYSKPRDAAHEQDAIDAALADLDSHPIKRRK